MIQINDRTMVQVTRTIGKLEKRLQHLEAMEFATIGEQPTMWAKWESFMKSRAGVLSVWNSWADIRQGYHWTNSSTTEISSYGGAEIIRMDGASDYFYQAGTAFNVVGNETWIASELRGLTFGGWFNPIGEAYATNAGFMGRWGTTDHYLLYGEASSSKVKFLISSDGSTTANTLTGPDVFSDVGWHYLVAQWDPSTHMRIWYDDTVFETTTSIAATLHNSTTQNINCCSYADSNSNTLDCQLGPHFFARSVISADDILTSYYLLKDFFQPDGPQ